MATKSKGLKLSDWSNLSLSEQEISLKDMSQQASDSSLYHLNEQVSMLENHIIQLGLYYNISKLEIQAFLDGSGLSREKSLEVDISTMNFLLAERNHVREILQARSQSIQKLYQHS